MSQKVQLEEGDFVSVHTRIKDMCKEARNRLGVTNQEICNMICERFGLEDFSVNTVNNFFSERSKATTIYTTGYICAVLGISIDAVFGIESDTSSKEDNELYRQLADLKVEIRLTEQKNQHLMEFIQEKEQRLEQAHKALEHYQREAEANLRKVQPWVFITVLSILVCLMVFIIVYILVFDVGNPNYGLFRSASSSLNAVQSHSAFIHNELPQWNHLFLLS